MGWICFLISLLARILVGIVTLNSLGANQMLRPLNDLVAGSAPVTRPFYWRLSACLEGRKRRSVDRNGHTRRRRLGVTMRGVPADGQDLRIWGE